MWWIIYFWISITLGIISFIDFLLKPDFNPVSIFYLLNFYFAVFSIYAYIYRKVIFSFTFWKIYFWGNLILDFLYTLYNIFPNAPIIQLLSFLSISDKPGSVIILLTTVLDIPILYAIYRLSQGKYLGKKVNQAKNKWQWWKILLWVYSVIYILFWLLIALIMCFYPSNQPTADDPIAGIIMGALFIPVLLFLILIGKENLS